MQRLQMFVLAIIVGQLLHGWRIPIPFMLGGILAGTFLRFTLYPQAKWKRSWRDLALCVAGYGIGKTFTRTTLGLLGEQLTGVVGATVVVIIMSLVMANFTFRHTRANLISCVMGLLPGGMNQMMYMADEDPRVDANVVIVQQTLRVIGVVFSMPFLVAKLFAVPVHDVVGQMVERSGVPWPVMLLGCLACAYLARRIGCPTPALIGPIVGTAAFSCLYDAPLQPAPEMLMHFAQINIGLYMGSMLDKVRLRQSAEQVPYALGATAVMIAASIGTALLLSRCYGFTVSTAFLAMAPGGIAEMCLAGLSMDEDVSIILTYQIVRMMAMNLTVPFALDKWFGKANIIDTKGALQK